MGAHNIAIVEPESIRIWTSSYTIHPKFNYGRDGIDYDIALVRLPEPVKLSKYIKIISIRAKKTRYYIRRRPEVIEYSPNVGHYQPKVVQKMVLSVISNKKCTEMAHFFISDYMLCTAPVKPNIDSCVHLPGAPLIYDNTLIGIATYGNFMCDIGSPNIFINIEAHKSWIIENTDLYE